MLWSEVYAEKHGISLSSGKYTVNKSGGLFFGWAFFFSNTVKRCQRPFLKGEIRGSLPFSPVRVTKAC